MGGTAPGSSRRVLQPRTPAVGTPATPRRPPLVVTEPVASPALSEVISTPPTPTPANSHPAGSMAEARERLAVLQQDLVVDRVRSRHRSFQVSGPPDRLRLIGWTIVIVAIATVAFRFAWTTSLAWHNMATNLEHHRSQADEAPAPP